MRRFCRCKDFHYCFSSNSFIPRSTLSTLNRPFAEASAVPGNVKTEHATARGTQRPSEAVSVNNTTTESNNLQQSIQRLFGVCFKGAVLPLNKQNTNIGPSVTPFNNTGAAGGNPRTAKDLFPDIPSLFSDLHTTTRCSTPPGNGGARQSSHNAYGMLPGQLSCDLNNGKPTVSKRSTTSGLLQHDAQSPPSSIPPTMDPSHARHYAYAYSLWEHRNAQLLHMIAAIRQPLYWTQHMREAYEEDLSDGLRTTTNLSVFVLFPFMLLVSLLLFNETVLYCAALKHLRLVDYNAWLRKQDDANGK